MARTPIDAVIPARNEARTVGEVVSVLRSSKALRRIIVVDNGSSDDTAVNATKAGAQVVKCRQVGLGWAMKVGLSSTDAPTVLRTDADIENWNTSWLDRLVGTRGDMIRASFESPYDAFPVTRLVAEPLWRIVHNGQAPPPRILSGTYLFPTYIVPHQLADNWAFDMSLLCAAYDAGLRIATTNIGLLTDRERPIDHYVPMATDIINYMLARKERRLA